jgi:hypothetical protein
MSGNTPTPIALETAFAQGNANGFATLYIEVQNSDGTAPVLAFDSQSLSTTNCVLVQPTANPGNDPSFPVSQFAYVAVIQAQAAGTALVDLYSDNILNQQFAVTITQAQPQTASVPSNGIVVTGPD